MEQETQREPETWMVPYWGRGGPRMDTVKMCSVFIPTEQSMEMFVLLGSSNPLLREGSCFSAMELSSLILPSGPIYAFSHFCRCTFGKVWPKPC